MAEAAVREAREELGVDIAVIDPACAAYTCTDVLHPAQPPHDFHYAILHVLCTIGVNAPAGRTGFSNELLPRLTAQSDAAAALWVDLSALVREEHARGWPVPTKGAAAPRSGNGIDHVGALPDPSLNLGPQGAAVLGSMQAEAPPCLLRLQHDGHLVPLTVEVARLAVRQWALRGVATVPFPPGAIDLHRSR